MRLSVSAACSVILVINIVLATASLAATVARYLALSLLFMVIRRNDRRSAQVYEERRYTDPPL